MSGTDLILASASPYRADILRSLGLAFTQTAVNVDETPRSTEDPRALAERLGLAKAQAVAALQPSKQSSNGKPWLVIGSDQVCHHRGDLYGKPGNRETAIRQLRAFNGDRVTFSSSLALIASDGRQLSRVEDYECRFRQLSDQEIADYIDLDQPWDCAGAIRIEQGAALLMETTLGRDIHTLQGLPTMALREMMAELGYSIFDFIKTR